MRAVYSSLHTRGHGRVDDARAQVEDADAVRREAGGEELRHHSGPGLGDAVFGALGRDHAALTEVTKISDR